MNSYTFLCLRILGYVLGASMLFAGSNYTSEAEHRLQREHARIFTYHHTDKLWQLEINEMQRIALFGFQHSTYIKRLIKFVHPESLKSAQPTILIIIVPGTFSYNSATYFADGMQCYEELKAFARIIALKEKCSVEIMSFNWSGANNHHARYQAGKALAHIINTAYTNPLTYKTIYTVSQSHGGNIVNIASHYITKRMIDTMVQLATPVRESTNPLYCPTNFGTLYSFYSTEDIVQLLGAIDMSSFKRAFGRSGSSRKYSRKPTGTIKNIKVKINGKDPGHRSLKRVFGYLHPVLQKCDGYTLHHEFDLNIILKRSNKKKPHGDDPVMLAIREQTAAKIPHDNQERYRRELAFSEYEKNRYKQRYRHNINERPNPLSQLIGTFSSSLRKNKNLPPVP